MDGSCGKYWGPEGSTPNPSSADKDRVLLGRKVKTGCWQWGSGKLCGCQESGLRVRIPPGK